MELTNNNLVSYCGFYCGACPKYTKVQCEGCKGDSPKCAIGYKACMVRPCCIENGFKSCAECDKFESVKDCRLYNPFMIRFGQFITRTNRRLGIEMIKEKGETDFVEYMIDKNWVNELNKIDFHASKDLQVFGNVYETLLKELQSAGSSGDFYTPRAVVEFIAEITNPKLGEKVLDPACGTGGFLTAAIEHIRKAGVENIEQRKQLLNTVQGMELNPLPHMLAVTNLILHDIEVPDISYEDSLLRNQSIKPKNRVDVILANPPFGGNVDDATASTFPVGFRTKESADLFLVMMVN